jgi:hypothetical protein
VRKQVNDVPTTVVLDNNLGVRPEVVVVACASRSGRAGAQTGGSKEFPSDYGFR